MNANPSDLREIIRRLSRLADDWERAYRADPITVDGVEYQACPHCQGCGIVLSDAAQGKAARDARNKAGVTQTQIAEALGMDNTYISKLERGHQPWTAEMLARYRAALERVQ